MTFWPVIEEKPIEYSEAELRLIGSFGKEFEERVRNSRLLPFEVYTSLERLAFRQNLQGPNAEALRRVVNTIGLEPYRLTPEFDALCAF